MLQDAGVAEGRGNFGNLRHVVWVVPGGQIGEINGRWWRDWLGSWRTSRSRCSYLLSFASRNVFKISAVRQNNDTSVFIHICVLALQQALALLPRRQGIHHLRRSLAQALFHANIDNIGILFLILLLRFSIIGMHNGISSCICPFHIDVVILNCILIIGSCSFLQFLFENGIFMVIKMYGVTFPYNHIILLRIGIRRHSSVMYNSLNDFKCLLFSLILLLQVKSPRIGTVLLHFVTLRQVCRHLVSEHLIQFEAR